MKRIFDLVVSILILIFLFPIVCIIAIVTRVKLGAPIIFTQTRPGLKGKPFRMYKFRSMKDIYNHEGVLLPDSERLTPFGKFLRSTSLDEIPGLYNVVKGEMSLVGPRPLLLDYLKFYNERQAMRHEVKPGITGWAQVNGRNAISWEEKFELDVWYVENQNFFLDIKILALTVIKVLRRDGISSDTSVTMEGFKGSNRKSD